MRSGTQRTGQRQVGVGPRPRLSALLAGGCVTVLLAAGCTAASEGGASPTRSSLPNAPTASAQESCAVTQPTRGDVPAGVSKQKPGNVFGHDGLWVSAWWTEPDNLDRVRSKDLAADGYPFREKYASWTVRDGNVTAAGGVPRVTVKRVDGPGHGQASLGGFATGDSGDQWWPTIVAFSERGCWHVTEATGDDSITYVVKI